MKFSFSAEQDEFRASVRRFLADFFPSKEVRRLMESDFGWEREAWSAMCQELGLAALRIPESCGGHGFGFSEQCIALEEMGRVLACAPYFASAVLGAGSILNGANAEQQAILLPNVASGEVVATLAVWEDTGHWNPGAARMSAVRAGTGWRLNGHKSYVIDGLTADLLIVLARAPGSVADDGLSLFAVDRRSSGVTRQPLTALDPTRKLARLEFNDVQATLLGEEGGAASAIERTLTEAAVCLANEMMGGAARLREDALSYAMMRMQFGKPVAAFQSMKHKHADMLLEVELAKSAAYYAAAALDEGDADAPAMASLAKAAASETYLQTAIHAIQIHGGIGFTWENDTQLWFKRAKSSESLLGDAHHHRELMMQRWGQ